MRACFSHDQSWGLSSQDQKPPASLGYVVSKNRTKLAVPRIIDMVFEGVLECKTRGLCRRFIHHAMIKLANHDSAPPRSEFHATT